MRILDADPKILETYVISGLIFYFGKAIKAIASRNKNGVSVPIPHGYFKSILTENNRGALNMWSFILLNYPSQ